MNSLGTYHFIGVQAVNASALAGVNPDSRSETVHGIYPNLIAQRPGSVRVMRTAAEFFDIGTPRDYLATAPVGRRTDPHSTFACALEIKSFQRTPRPA